MDNLDGLTKDGPESKDAGGVTSGAGETLVTEEPRSTVLDTEPPLDDKDVGFPSTLWLCCIFVYVVTCLVWPEIPAAFLALVTSAGLLGAFDKTSCRNVSSQTSNQACGPDGVQVNTEADQRDIGLQMSTHEHMEGEGDKAVEHRLGEDNDNFCGLHECKHHESDFLKTSHRQKCERGQNVPSYIFNSETITHSREIFDQSGKRCKVRRSPVRGRDCRENYSYDLEDPQGDFPKLPGPIGSNRRDGELFFVATARNDAIRREKPILSSSARPKKSKSPSKLSFSGQKSRLRESCSEIVAGRSNRKEIPVFAKVWRVSEKEVKQTFSNTANIGDMVSMESDATDRLSADGGSPFGSSPRSSDDMRVIANFNGYDRNVNCHECQSKEDTHKPDFLTEPITAWLGDMQISCDHKPSDFADSARRCSSLPVSSQSLPPDLLSDQTYFCDCQGREKDCTKPEDRALRPDLCNTEYETNPAAVRDSQTQTVLFADILRINVKKFLQVETRQFHKRRSKLRFKYARELGKLKQELTGKNKILSSLQLKIPALGEEIRNLRIDKNELQCELEEEKSKTDNLMDRLTDVYQNLMLINSTRQVQLQEQLQQQQMHEHLQQYQLHKQLQQQQFPEQLQHLHVEEQLQQQNLLPEQFQEQFQQLRAQEQLQQFPEPFQEQLQQYNFLQDQLQHPNLIQQFQQQNMLQEPLQQPEQISEHAAQYQLQEQNQLSEQLQQQQQQQQQQHYQ